MPPPSPRADPTVSRKVAFRLAAVVFLPLLLLLVLELGLRVAGYGYRTDFFKPLRVGRRDFLVENDKFGLRFFPPELARSPAPVKMEARKPTGTVRIFILGESAALGDPRPAYGAGRYLQVLLEERFPGTRFEVVCVAMTAINSHAILPIARECARHEGDVWIVYMGNNEMVGPFGATPVFGARAPPLWFVRLDLALQNTRVGQLVVALGRKLRRGHDRTSPWAGMEMFVKSQISPDAPARDTVLQNFGRNLNGILRAGLASGAHIILNTVAVNLRDCPPFASVRPPGQSPLPKPGAPAAEYEHALQLSPSDAEAHYLLGESYLGRTNNSAAAREFGLARDLDTLPFRATSRINALITLAAANCAGLNLAFFDAAGFFATNSPAGIPGREWFYEHVHFNYDGNYRLARAWAAQVERCLPAGARNAAASDWASQELCERRLGLSDWTRADLLDDLLRRMSQPPLSTQSNNAQRVTKVRAELTTLRRRMTRDAAEQARDVYLEALKQAPEDFLLHQNYAQFLEAVGDLPGATAEWERVRDLIPHHHLAWFEIGRLLSRQGQWAAAQEALWQAVALRPDLSEGWLELGQIHYRQGNQTLALAEYERARRLLPQDYRVYYHIGRSLSKMNRRTAAIEQFRQALRLRPSYWEALYALGEELAFDGQIAEASSRFQQVLQLKPEYPLAHLNLGVALVAQGRLEAAVEQFQETLKLDPQNKQAREYLAKVQARLGK